MTEMSLSVYQKQVDDLLQNDKFDEVITHCRYILKAYPKNVRAHRQLGQALFATAQWDEAAEVFQQLLGVSPHDFSAQFSLSQIYQQLAQYDDAIWHAERAFDQQPNNEQVIETIRALYQTHRNEDVERIQLTTGAVAQQHIQNELYTQAINVLDKTLQNHSDRVDLQILRAQALWAMDNRVAAAESALDILAVQPYSLDANCILAELWLMEQRPSDAKPYVSRVEELDPYLAFRLTTEEEPPESLVMIDALDIDDRLQQEPEEIVPSSVADDELSEFADPLFGDEAEFVKGDAPLSLDKNDADIDPSELFGEITGESVEELPSVDAVQSEPLSDAEIDPSELFGEITGASVEELPSLDAIQSEPLSDEDIDLSELFGEITGESVEELSSVDAVQSEPMGDEDIDPSELFGEITGESIGELSSVDDLSVGDDDLSDMSWLDKLDDIHIDTGNLPEADLPNQSNGESDEAWFQELQDLEVSSLTPTGLTESDEYVDGHEIDSADWYVTEQDDDSLVFEEQPINSDEAFGLHVDTTVKPTQDIDGDDDFDDIALDFPMNNQQGIATDDSADVTDAFNPEPQDDSGDLHKLLRPLSDDMSMDDDLFRFDDEDFEEFEFDTLGLPVVDPLSTDTDDNDWLTDFDDLDNTDSFEWLSDSEVVADDVDKQEEVSSGVEWFDLDDDVPDDRPINEQSGGIEFDDEPLLDSVSPSAIDDDDVDDVVVAVTQTVSVADDEELEHTPADSAPDWLNAMVPGLDNNFDTQDIDPLDEVLEDVQQEEQASAGFAWLNDIVEIETGAMPPVTPKPAPPPAVPLRFTFSNRPVWLDKLLGLDTDNVSQAAKRRANIDDNLPDWLDIDNSN